MLLDIFYIHLIFYLPHNFPTLLQLFYFYPCSRCERTKRKIARLFFLILIDRSERPKKRKINIVILFNEANIKFSLPLLTTTIVKTE